MELLVFHDLRLHDLFPLLVQRCAAVVSSTMLVLGCLTTSCIFTLLSWIRAFWSSLILGYVLRLIDATLQVRIIMKKGIAVIPCQSIVELAVYSLIIVTSICVVGIMLDL